MKFILLALFFCLSNFALAIGPVNCLNSQGDVQSFVCEDVVLNNLNNQSVILSLEIPEQGNVKKAVLEQQFQVRVDACGLDQICWIEAYQSLIQKYEELKQLYENKAPPVVGTQKDESFWPSFSSLLMIILLVSIFIFFLPSFIAFNRQHRNRLVILVINIVFGFTLLGWLVALIWSLNKIDSPIKGGSKYDPQPNDPTL